MNIVTMGIVSIFRPYNLDDRPKLSKNAPGPHSGVVLDLKMISI